MSDTDPYLQRNAGDSPVDVPAIPATVGPGETVAWHLPIAGFEPAPADPPPAPKTTAKTTPPAQPAQPTAAGAAGQE